MDGIVSKRSEALLRRSSDVLGIRPEEILDRVLNVAPLASDPRFAGYISGLSTDMVEVLELLDDEVRAYNPGCHYVPRQQFIGYRRADRLATGPASERSQIFLSLVPRRRGIHVFLPLNPTAYAAVPRSEDLRGKGHHGVGDLRVDVGSIDQVRAFVSAFESWLRPEDSG